MDLSIVHRGLVYEIREGMTYIADGNPVVDLSEIYETLSLQFEALGICHLFEFADTNKFRENLVRSAHGRRHFLRQSRAQGNDQDRRLALSRTRAFLDAIVAGSLPVALDIANLSNETWNPNWEYEDDYCFYLFMHRIVQRADPFPTTETLAILERFKRALEGGDSIHYDICTALAARDSAAFGDALGKLVEKEKKRIEADRNSAAVREGDLVYWATSRLSIEGLALLRIANLLGIDVANSLDLCPPLARLPLTDQPFQDLFEEITAAG